LHSGTEKPYVSRNIIGPQTEITVSKSDHNRKRIVIKFPNLNLKDSLDQVDECVMTNRKDAVVISVMNEAERTTSLYWYDFKSKQKRFLWKSKPNEKIEFIDRYKNSYGVFFKAISPKQKPNPALAPVDIWSYKDADYPNSYPEIPNPFLRNSEFSGDTYAISALADHPVIQITGLNETLLDAKGDQVLIEKQNANSAMDWFWNENTRPSFYNISIKNAKKSFVAQQGAKELEVELSPDGKYVILINHGDLTYSSHNTTTGTIKQLTAPAEIYVTFNDEDRKVLPYGLLWDESESLLIKDDYDLWKLDVSGVKKPINVTSEVGRKNGITFYLLKETFKRGKLLSAYNHQDKSWGFYSLKSFNGDIPQKLSMGPYYFGGSDAFRLVKAKDADVYVLSRETVKESTNLFVTRDFKRFERISNHRPELAYNWMDADLIKWKVWGDKEYHGLLYKPENFDPEKSYPVVTYIYNNYSDKKNEFMEPDEHSTRNAHGNFLPTSWLISNGYLVFIPDVHHRKPGARLQSSLEIVTQGVAEISKLPYVNAKKIGIEGSSWGGEQVGYIITHSKLFAAAFLGCGFTDQISRIGFSDAINPDYALNVVEHYQGGTLNDVPERYINESAIFRAQYVSTPTLIKHTKDDGAVPFYHGLQFFRLLRRYNKKSWLLQYDNGTHGIAPGVMTDDLYLRMSQFYDHYLKDKPAPRWMTEGRPAELKQIDAALEIDANGKTP
jgi:dipeptidyl aminopeptidase/acylaminoacyl peptidase